MSKKLRILTGRHAGASQDLCVGIHTVGRADDCQIFITDWGAQQPGISLELVRSGGGQSLSWFESGADDHAAGKRRHALRDLQPVRFGDIVLCSGPVSSAWPSDAALLQRMFGPGSLMKRAAARHRVLLCSVLAIGLTAVTGLAAYSTAAEPAVVAVTPDKRAASLASRIEALGILTVSVVAEQDAVVVSGLVEDDQQAHRLDVLLKRDDGQPAIVRRYASASQVASMIHSGLGENGVNVLHRGQGVFAVEGKVRSLDAAQRKAASLSSDMQATVRRIEMLASEKEGPASQRFLAVLVDDTNPYVQTSEGVKHLGLMAKSPLPSASASAASNTEKSSTDAKALVAAAASYQPPKELP
jgi:type III secretion protein D